MTRMNRLAGMMIVAGLSAPGIAAAQAYSCSAPMGGSDRVRLHGGRGRLVAGNGQNGLACVGSTTGRTSTPPKGAGHSLAISTAWSRSRASTT